MYYTQFTAEEGFFVDPASLLCHKAAQSILCQVYDPLFWNNKAFSAIDPLGRPFHAISRA